MNKILFSIFFFFSIGIYAQTEQMWKGYFSYNEIKAISQSANRFFAASENAIFSKNINSGDIKTTNTIDGLSSQTISAIYHSEKTKKTLVGYDNGLFTILNESDGKIYKFVDIINKQLPPNIKRINHFYEYNDVIYLSCDFGIVQFKINAMQFGDTYFIGSSPSEISVMQTAVFKGFIYAATKNNGLKRADFTNPNLIDVANWDSISGGNFTGIATLGNFIVVSQSYGYSSKSTDGMSYSQLNPLLADGIVDIRTADNQIVITSPSTVNVYNENLNLLTQVNASQIAGNSVIFSAATTLNNKIYIATKANGVIATAQNSGVFEFISPSGPLKNEIFSINAQSSKLWAVYGGYTENFTPFYAKQGFSNYTTEQGWKNFSNDDANQARDLCQVTINPKNENQVFISSYFNGLLKFDNETLSTQYTKNNSGLEPIFLTDPPTENLRIEQSAFDKKGNLWMTNGILKNPLKVLLSNGQWQSYNMEGILNDWTDSRLSKITIDKNSTKWIVSRSDGLIGFNENYNNKFKKIAVGTEPGNLPSLIQTAAIDTRNQIWIGTRRGLRILSSVDAFLGDEPMKSTSIIILDNGLAQELLYEQYITDIVVDGANNKWIGTADAGVFQFSPNGQETLHHFTSENSPLPNNNITDVEINPTTGEVFFATTKGMVSYKRTAIKAADNLENVVVFPNPVHPEFEGNVTITGLTNKANVKITDIEGNLVHEQIAEGGSIEWNTTAFGKYRVASGVYMIFIAAKDGEFTKVKKVMIIR